VNFALLLAYDGAAFRGWQKQPGEATVQGVLEKAIGNVVHGASRTDAGVSALGQVASFRRGSAPDFAALDLPPALRLLRWASVPDSFHARASSCGKVYRYDFGHFVQNVQNAPDWERARAALKALEGLAEMPGIGSPAKAHKPAPPLTRWSLGDDGILELEARAFRKHEVRNIAGHLAAIALGYADPSSLRELAARKRPWMGATAPAAGLTLVRVLYPEPIDPFIDASGSG
jgi:tRNA pseudouridine38-40 synthase